MPVEMALDLASLALYDIILYGEATHSRWPHAASLEPAS
jgi:hypothetical protein